MASKEQEDAIIDLKLDLIRYLKGELVDDLFDELKDMIRGKKAVDPLSLSRCPTFEKLWQQLEQRQLIIPSDGDCNFLKGCFEKMRQKEWAKEVGKYEETVKAILQPLPMPSQPSPDNAPLNPRPTSQLPEYKMTSVPRGLCVIINNVKFKQEDGGVKLSDRLGSNVDAGKLETLFQKLKFTVKKREDLSSTAIVDLVIEVAHQTDHSKFDCLVFCILSHGSRGNIFGVDGHPVDIDTIKGHFSGLNCRTLGGKPKLFFLQACRGRTYQIAARRDGDNEDDTDSVNSDVTAASSPNLADILIAYPTVLGSVSFRNIEIGSYFIRKLVELLDEHCDRLDVLSILTMVNDAVAEEAPNIDGGVYRQIPSPSHTLRKAVYLRSDR